MEKKVSVGNDEVVYFVEGKGPGMLLIHGTGGTYENTWGELIKFFSDKYKIVAPNYSRSDGTQVPGDKLQLEILIEQNLQAVLQEGIQQFHVIGYSLGAEIAAGLAAMYPDRVKSVTMIAGWVESNLATTFQFDLWQKLFHTDRNLFAHFLIHTGFSPSFYNNFNNMDQLLQLVNDFSGVISKGTDWQSELDGRMNIRPLLSSVHAPSLVIGLTYDRMVPVENAKELASLIKGAQYREIASGHLVPWEKSDILIEEVSRFINSLFE